MRKDLQMRFHPDIRFSFRFLTADDGFPKSRLWKRKRDMDMRCRRERTAGMEAFKRFGTWFGAIMGRFDNLNGRFAGFFTAWMLLALSSERKTLTMS